MPAERFVVKALAASAIPQEETRTIIGHVFISTRLQAEAAVRSRKAKLSRSKGTLYPDVIETARRGRSVPTPTSKRITTSVDCSRSWASGAVRTVQGPVQGRGVPHARPWNSALPEKTQSLAAPFPRAGSRFRCRGPGRWTKKRLEVLRQSHAMFLFPRTK